MVGYAPRVVSVVEFAPKLNLHGVGYDPFRSAPEFGRMHSKRYEGVWLEACGSRCVARGLWRMGKGTCCGMCGGMCGKGPLQSAKSKGIELGRKVDHSALHPNCLALGRSLEACCRPTTPGEAPAPIADLNCWPCDRQPS